MKERDKFENSNIFEGIVSFRAVLSTILDKKSDRQIITVYYDSEKAKKKPKEYSFLKAKSFELGYELLLVDKEEIDGLTLGNSHGGLAFVCTNKSYPVLNGVHVKDNGFYVMLDGIEDPYNFGYSLRSLYASGATGIILPERNWLGAAGVVCRASAGASEQMEIYIADGDFIKTFKSLGYKIVCSDLENSIPMYDADLKKPLLLIIGGEKRGISANILENTDSIVRIEYGNDFPAALSAASASAILAFEVYRQNR